MERLEMHTEMREVYVLSDGRAYIDKKDAEAQIRIRDELIERANNGTLIGQRIIK